MSPEMKAMRVLSLAIKGLCVVIILYGVYSRIVHPADSEYWYYNELDSWQFVFAFPALAFLITHLLGKVANGEITPTKVELPKGTIHKSLDELREQLYGANREEDEEDEEQEEEEEQEEGSRL